MVGLPGAQYLLRWNDHLSNYGDIFLTLREEEEFVDCSLACEDGVVGAHRVVLAGCSPYLRHLFARVDNPHPVIFLLNTPRSLVLLLMEFIYRGQVHIPQNKLQQLVTLGRSLKIKGLTQIMVPVTSEAASSDALEPQTEISDSLTPDSLTPMAFPHGLPLPTLANPFAGHTVTSNNNISILSCEGGGDDREENRREELEAEENIIEEVEAEESGEEEVEAKENEMGGEEENGSPTAPVLPKRSPRAKNNFNLVEESSDQDESPKPKSKKSPLRNFASGDNKHNIVSYKTMGAKYMIGAHAMKHGIEETKRFVTSKYNVKIRQSTINNFISIYKRRQDILEGRTLKRKRLEYENDSVNNSSAT